jgi:hypothetical protein
LKTHYFVYNNGQYQYVDLKDGIYSKTVSYKRVSIDPQPDPSSILTLRRMYNSLKRQPDYKRRICWAEIVPTSLTTTGKQVAVVEYIGPYPDNISIHGNAK